MSHLQDDFGTIILGILLVGVFITIGQILHLFDWVGPTIAFIWLIIQVIFVILIIGGMIYLVYYIFSGMREIKEKEKIQEIGKARRKQFEEMGISFNEVDGITGNEKGDFKLGLYSDIEFEQLKNRLIKEKKESEITARGLSRRNNLSDLNISQYSLNNFELGSLTEDDFIQFKETLVKEKEKLEKINASGRARIAGLERQGVSIDKLNNYDMGKMDETNFLQYRETLINENKEKKKINERGRIRITSLEKQGVSEDELNICEIGKMDEKDFLQYSESLIKDILINKVVKSIEIFNPHKEWPDEDSYQKELLGYLKRDYAGIQYELQTGSSRPDLVIGNIAIEIKGPTDNQALDTLTTKCLKYSNYYDHLIIVLFKPIFTESNFNEIKQGIDKHFPHVKVIRK